jgi:hypothetical protein
MCRHWQARCLPHLPSSHHAPKGLAAMTSSTIAPAAVNGGTTPSHDRGLPHLRAKEAKGLISLAADASSETADLIHQLHTAIHDRSNATPDEQLGDRLEETLTCLQTCEHYLLMLGSVIDERIKATAAPGGSVAAP